MTNEEMRSLLREILPFIGWDGEGAEQAAEKARAALRDLAVQSIWESQS